MLPAIVFIFSRAACDDAVGQCLDDGVRLTTPSERAEIRERCEEHTEGLPDDELRVLGYGPWMAGLEAGVASHHAGLIPAFREAVEDCFTAGLLQVVFATETLSLGINMPARSVVIERLTKMRDHGRVGAHVGGVRPADRARRSPGPRLGRATPWCRGRPQVSDGRGGHAGHLAGARSHVLVPAVVQPGREPGPALPGRPGPRPPRPLLRPVPDAPTPPCPVAAHGPGPASFSSAGATSTSDAWRLTASGALLARHLPRVRSPGGRGAGRRPLRRTRPAGAGARWSRPAPTRSGPGAGTPSRGRRRRSPAAHALVARAEGLRDDEQTPAWPAPALPDPGFAEVAWRWARGERLARVLERAELAPGDFVRNAKQLIDLLASWPRWPPTRPPPPPPPGGRPRSTGRGGRLGRPGRRRRRGRRRADDLRRGRDGVPTSRAGPRGPDRGSRSWPAGVRHLGRGPAVVLPGHVPLRRGDVHRRRGRGPPAVRHEPRRAGLCPGQPARSGEGGPLRPLLALGQEPAPAVPRRVRRRPRRERRRRRRRHHRAAAGRGALRAGLLRVRRRLGGPARRCPPGLRAGLQRADQGARVGPAHGLPRAVDPLHRLRLPSRHRATTATTATPMSSTRRSGPATWATWTACSTPTPRCCPSSRPGSPALSRSSRATPTSSTASRSGPRPSTPCGVCCRPASLSNVGIYGTGQSYELLLLRMRAHPLPEARRYAELMLAELRKVIPSFLQRVDRPRPGRGLVRLPGRHPAPRPTRWWAGCGPTGRSARGGRGGRRHAVDLDPEGEDKVLAAICYPHMALSEPGSPAPGAGPRRRGPAGHRAGLRGGADQPPAPARPGLRAHRLPLRRRLRLRRLPRPPAPPHADHRVAALDPALGYEVPDVVGEAGLAEPFESLDGAVGRTSTRPWSRRFPTRRPTPWPWPSGSATSCR